MSARQIKLCWQCGQKLEASYAKIQSNNSVICVHKVCKVDAENLLLRNKITWEKRMSMTLVEFADLVSHMRAAQKTYFKKRSQPSLLESIKLEREVDRAVDQLIQSRMKDDSLSR